MCRHFVLHLLHTKSFLFNNKLIIIYGLTRLYFLYNSTTRTVTADDGDYAADVIIIGQVLD